jgi:hypothetical protein
MRNNNNLTNYLKGRWDENEIMMRRNNKEIAGFCLNLNLNNDVSLILCISFK